MVRTRWLCWALGRLLRRGLGRQVTGDEEEVPQCRRPTTSACRQWTTTIVAEDINHVDHAVDEVHEQL